MGFEQDLFKDAVQKQRKLWLAGIKTPKTAGENLGWLSVSVDGEEFREDALLVTLLRANAGTITNNHEKLQDTAWKESVEAAAKELAKSLLQIPALRQASFHCSMAFRYAAPTKTQAAPLPAFTVGVMGVNLTKAPIKTFTSTLKRLYELKDDLAPLGAPKAPLAFEIGGKTWNADSAEDAARLYAAIVAPALIGNRKNPRKEELPKVVRLYDQELLTASLRAA